MMIKTTIKLNLLSLYQLYLHYELDFFPLIRNRDSALFPEDKKRTTSTTSSLKIQGDPNLKDTADVLLALQTSTKNIDVFLRITNRMN